MSHVDTPEKYVTSFWCGVFSLYLHSIRDFIHCSIIMCSPQITTCRIRIIKLATFASCVFISTGAILLDWRGRWFMRRTPILYIIREKRHTIGDQAPRIINICLFLLLSRVPVIGLDTLHHSHIQPICMHSHDQRKRRMFIHPFPSQTSSSSSHYIVFLELTCESPNSKNW